MQYGEGPRGEPAGRRLVTAADRRLQQKRSRIMRAWVIFGKRLYVCKFQAWRHQAGRVSTNHGLTGTRTFIYIWI
jgi:hypothetical protein